MPHPAGRHRALLAPPRRGEGCSPCWPSHVQSEGARRLPGALAAPASTSWLEAAAKASPFPWWWSVRGDRPCWRLREVVTGQRTGLGTAGRAAPRGHGGFVPTVACLLAARSPPAGPRALAVEQRCPSLLSSPPLHGLSPQHCWALPGWSRKCLLKNPPRLRAVTPSRALRLSGDAPSCPLAPQSLRSAPHGRQRAVASTPVPGLAPP